MRRAIAIVILMAMGLVPIGVQAEQTIQSENGTIMLPTRFTDGTSGWPGLGRRVWLASAGTNGTIAWIFNIDRASWGGAFAITDVTDDTGAADLDIFFYQEFGDVAGDMPPVTVGEFATQAPGGESGIVPEDAIKAVVFTANGVNSSFAYNASAPTPAV